MARANKDGIAWPSMKTIKNDCLLNEGTCWAAIAELAKRGLIQKLGKKFGGSNRYRVCISPITPKKVAIEERIITPKEDAIENHPITPPFHTPITPSFHTPITPSFRAGMLSNECNPMNVIKERDSDQSLPFSSEAFSSAWNRWQQHRRELKKKLTPSTAKAQLAKLGLMGEEAAIAAIDHSIAGGWQGIFQPRETNNNPSPRKIDLGGRQSNITTI